MNLRQKLLVSYMMVGLLPLLVIGLYAYRSFRADKFESLSECFTAQLNQIDFTLSTFLDTVEADVEALAQNPVVRVRDASAFTNFVYADETAFRYAIGAAEGRIIDLFANYRDYHDYANSVYMGRENGAFVRSHPRARPTQYDPRLRPWYQLALSQPRQVMRTAPYRSVTTDDVNVGIVKALVADDGAVFGVVGIDITLRNLTAIVSRMNTGMRGAILLLDSDGMFLTNPVPERRFQHYAEAGLPAFDELFAVQRGHFEFRDQGEAWHAFFITSAKLGWKICAVVPSAEVEREITALLGTVIAVVALSLVVGSLQAYVIARQVTIPLKSLMRGIQQLGEQMTGQREFAPIQGPADTEIGPVFNTLNAVGKRLVTTHQELRLYNENLEQMVAERTAQISRANAQLRHEQVELRKLSRAVESSANSIVITDLQGRIEFINPAFTTFTGYTLDDVRGRTPRILKSGRMPPELYDDLWRTITQGQVWKGELLNCRKDGSQYWEFTTISPVNTTADVTTHYVAVKEDITERKRMEEALRAATENAMEARQAAEAAREAAEAANRTKSRFLANMSHELRTPLNGILGYAQILKMQRQLTDFQQKAIDIIERSGRHLLNLINDVLDISKIEAQKIDLEPAPLLLSAFVHDLVEIVRVQAERKGLTVELELAPDVPAAVLADEKRLSQVLLNILGNAVKFTDRGRVTLRVSARHDEAQENGGSAPPPPALSSANTPAISFEIHDTGIGMRPEHVEEIFSAFTQVGQQPRTIEGTGLGLAISRELVRLMGGELRVRSTEGAGSTFWFTIPLALADQEAVLYTDEGGRIVGFTTPSGATPKILVVDDRDENRTLLAGLLLSLGFEVHEAGNGEEGVALARDLTPDLIFMDLIMPVMDGFEAARRVRRDPELSGTRIIAVSASTMISAANLRSQFGFDDYVPKPLQIQEIFRLLAHHLDLAWRYEDTAPAPPEREIAPVAAVETVPPDETLEWLETLTRDGNFTALRAALEQLEAQDSRYQPFVDQIRQLADNLAEDAICERLAAYRGEVM